jgi:hypothetical protein
MDCVKRYGKRATLAVRGLAVVFLVLMLSGCATDLGKTSDIEALPQPSTTESASAPRWYYFRFRFSRTSAEDTERYLDLLVANEIVAEVLEEHRDDLVLWRFHRRWPDDATGHQFSWIVLTKPELVAVLDDKLQNTDAFDDLNSTGKLREYRVDLVRAEDPTALAATSDRAWSEALQREWPYFIEGASRMWLGLVQAEVERQDGSLLDRYRAASEAVDGLWFEQANHALFHHLSALFGYQPVRVIRRDVMTF